MALTTTRPRTTAPPGHWETTGRLALALCALVLGTALAFSWSNSAGATGLLLLAALAVAVLYPDVARRLHDRVATLAVPVAFGVVAEVLISSWIFGGSPLAVLAWIGGLSAAALIASPLFHVGPKRLR